jgi:hypothetical protein
LQKSPKKSKIQKKSQFQENVMKSPKLKTIEYLEKDASERHFSPGFENFKMR